jgi:hypothetical protein
MRITNAGIKSKYPTAPQFLFTDIWFEAEIDETDEDAAIAHTLKLISMADKAHRLAYPNMYGDNPSAPLPPEPEVLPESQIIRSGDVTKDLAYQINTSENYDTLGKAFGPLMKLGKYADVLPIYEARREFLKQKEIAHILEMTEAQTKTSNIIKGKKNLE